MAQRTGTKKESSDCTHDLLKKLSQTQRALTPITVNDQDPYSSELNLNDAIHDAWKARAQMDRFLRNDESKVM